MEKDPAALTDNERGVLDEIARALPVMNAAGKQPSCKDALRGLLNELYEDRTDLADLIEAAGLDEEDLDDIEFSLD